MEKIIYVIPFVGIMGMLFALFLAARINNRIPAMKE